MNQEKFNQIIYWCLKTLKSKEFPSEKNSYYKDESFENLFKKIYNDKEEIERKTKSMYQFYSRKQENEYGVVGIKIALLSDSFRYTYNKLVRDKIPEEIDSEIGRKCKYRILDDEEYLKELNRKVIEEANDFIEENSIEELGDLMEVINVIIKLKDYKNVIKQIKNIAKMW